MSIPAPPTSGNCPSVSTTTFHSASTNGPPCCVCSISWTRRTGSDRRRSTRRWHEDRLVKIASVETRLVDLPLPRSIGTSIHAIDSVGCVLVTLRTDEGIDGESFVFTINGARLRAFDEMIRGLGELVVGCDPHETGAIWHDLWMEINPTGHAGVTIASMSSLDVACWDIVGRACRPARFERAATPRQLCARARLKHRQRLAAEDRTFLEHASPHETSEATITSCRHRRVRAFVPRSAPMHGSGRRQQDSRRRTHSPVENYPSTSHGR